MSLRGSTIAVAAAAALYSIVYSIVSGCSQELPARSTLELMDQPAVLEAVITRCHNLSSEALKDEECRNARDAVERLAAKEAEKSPADVDPAFERAREVRRAREELERQRHEAEQQVDPYTMPLVTDPEPADEMASASDPSGQSG